MMLIPMDLILERLAYLQPENHLKKTHQHRWIQGIKLLPPRCDGLREEYLYVTDRCYPVPEDSEASVVILDAESLWTAYPPSYLLTRADVPLPDVFDELLGLQILLQKWDLQLSLSVSEKRGIQHLLDLSEPVLGNPIAVLDPAYRCLAITRDFDTDDLVFDELQKLGYLTQETFNKLQKNNCFTQDHYTGETLVIPPSDLKEYTSTLTAVLDKASKRVNYELLMICSNVPFSEGLFQLYLYLQERILSYLDASTDNGTGRERYEYFVLDLLEERCTSLSEINERSKCFLAHCSNQFNAIVILLERNTDMYRKFAFSTLQELFPEFPFVIYQNYILFFADLGDIERHLEKQASSVLSRLTEYLAQANAYAGISARHDQLYQLRQAYVQAEHVLYMGKKLGERLNPNVDKRTFWSCHYHIYQIIDVASQNLPSRALVDGLYSAIIEYDKTHQTRYMEILLAYLHHERRFTSTAQELQMHRNTVIYHIHHICELFHMDLDYGELRLQLLLSERVHKMYPEWFENTHK